MKSVKFSPPENTIQLLGGISQGGEELVGGYYQEDQGAS